MNSQEHIGITFTGADGNTYNSPLFSGTNENANSSALSSWMNANGVGWSQVQALTHNHDADTYGQDSENTEVNRYPSGNQADESGNDWNAATQIVGYGANPNVFGLTIIDTTGATRFFPYTQKGYYQGLSTSQMENGTGLPSQSAC